MKEIKYTLVYESHNSTKSKDGKKGSYVFEVR